jgi:hypothetical protein
VSRGGPCVSVRTVACVSPGNCSLPPGPVWPAASLIRGRGSRRSSPLITASPRSGSARPWMPRQPRGAAGGGGQRSPRSHRRSWVCCLSTPWKSARRCRQKERFLRSSSLDLPCGCPVLPVPAERAVPLRIDPEARVGQARTGEFRVVGRSRSEMGLPRLRRLARRWLAALAGTRHPRGRPVAVPEP